MENNENHASTREEPAGPAKTILDAAKTILDAAKTILDAAKTILDAAKTILDAAKINLDDAKTNKIQSCDEEYRNEDELVVKTPAEKLLLSWSSSWARAFSCSSPCT
jgi:hypothetical protein